MALRGDWQLGDDFEGARAGTLYWTLSLYMPPDDVAGAAGQPELRLTQKQFADVQQAHLPSMLLRNAIDPLFNDIADREVLGEVQEHLLAVDDAPTLPTADQKAQRKAAEKQIRSSEKLIFKMPDAIEWSTEGVTYCATPPGLEDERAVRFRRFWLAHNNGALSYHMAFSHHYASLAEEGDVRGYDPSTFYFLSLLQKLAAPKEFQVEQDEVEPDTITSDKEKPRARDGTSVFEGRTGIHPLDGMKVTDEAGNTRCFWPFVKQRLLKDAEKLFDRLEAKTGKPRAAVLEPWLINKVPFIEVPGLTVPKSRFMFLFDDERFFKRLMPVDPTTNASIARKFMVREECYAPYQRELAARIKQAEKADTPVQLDVSYWQWVANPLDYEAMISPELGYLRPDPDSLFPNVQTLVPAIRNGTALRTVDAKGEPLDTPEPLHIPAFELGRTDCLDYLFLAGFNQNIIDFMNQDTSEILDSIDPIYPDSNEQSDERFFVRYANHRAMVTYVPKSRSLEAGNDYIGTCPYAFLIHALAMHNEFLAREHEERSMARIERIEYLVSPAKDREQLTALDEREPLDGDTRFDKAEYAINQAKLAEYRDFERFRYANPFRYDTERDVFAKLEELRGTTRKKNALAMAIASLEDHASDLGRRHQQKVDADAARRETQLNILLGGTGIFGAGQMIYWIGESAAGDPYSDPPKPAEPVDFDLLGLYALRLDGNTIMNVTEAVMIYALLFFVPFFIYILASAAWKWARNTRPDLWLHNQPKRWVRWLTR
ncbi:hypothetical protein [Blastomonas aquatica]|uniref:Lipoxygenase domain-containing protein n=1 Tax=Blastomonas aquatica TaxID=1510276 RepID=A0ABQ1JLP6_9SPHN|nr:hypothetical protein [Blastomonas aquatica]GGB69866.1 hypothetical protein GCM10010833_26370 [Blastomonas aquatica]